MQCLLTCYGALQIVVYYYYYAAIRSVNELIVTHLFEPHFSFSVAAAVDWRRRPAVLACACRCVL